MADHTNLEALISDTLVEMRRLGYSENTITGFRRMFAAFSRYAVSQGRKESGEELAIRFPDAKFGVELTQPCQANPGGSYLKAWLRAMRVLLEMGECGRVCKRMPGDLVRTELPEESRSLPGPSDDASRRAGHSESTTCSRNGRIKHFLIFLAGNGGTDASCITESSAHDHVPAKSSNHAKSVRAILTALRCLPRHPRPGGTAERDLSPSVPNPKPCHAPELPSTWTADEVSRLTDGIGRGNPRGEARLRHAAHGREAGASGLRHKVDAHLRRRLVGEDDIDHTAQDWRGAGATAARRHRLGGDRLPAGRAPEGCHVPAAARSPGGAPRRVRRNRQPHQHTHKACARRRHQGPARPQGAPLPAPCVGQAAPGAGGPDRGHIPHARARRQAHYRHLPPHGRRLPVRMRARPGAGRMAFAKITSAYVAERRAVGPRCERDDRVMARIAASRGELGCPEDELPRALVEARAAKRPGESETTRPCRAGQVRGLANRMMRAGYDAYVAPGGRGRADRGAYEPHILADAELASPSPAAGAVAGGDPASRRAQAARLPGLPCSSGLRCGEACSLAKGDAAPEAGIPAIRHAKNGRGRLVPPRPSMTHMLRIFHDTAALRHPRYGGHGLFWSLPEGRPTATGLACRPPGRAPQAAGMPHGGRGRGPRVRDLRLAFACHRLRNWVREGADADAMMPVLAAHVGHADIRRAEYYLRPAAGTCPGMVAQVERECGWVVPS